MKRTSILRKAVIVQGLHIAYYQNEGFSFDRPVVFFHGWGSQSLCFQRTLENCGNGIAIDFPGFGGSDVPPSAWSIGEYAVFLQDVLEKLHIRDCILVGHSFGGSVVIKYAATFGNARKLILIGSAGIRRRTLKVRVWHFFSKVFGPFLQLPFLRMFREGVRKKLYAFIGSEDYVRAGPLTDIYGKIIREDLSEDMSKIRIPSVLIWGENDRDTPLEDGYRMHSLIRGSRLRVIKNAGHYVFLDNETEFGKVFSEETI